MIPVRLAGKSHLVGVTKEGSLLTSDIGYPPRGLHPTKPFFWYLRNSAGSENMSVNGSVTPVEFSVNADGDNDRYITGLSIILGYGGTAYLFEFADELALTNGITIKYYSAFGNFDICDAVKKNSDLLRLAVTGIQPTWEARNFLAINDYGYTVFIDLVKFLPPYGIKLDAGSVQKISVSIRDNLTVSADLFNIFAIGFERF